MNDAELLMRGRDLLLKFHKALVDHERRMYEGIYGRVNAGQFLNMLLDEAEFAWLRRFSSLIVDIDELFGSREGFDEEDATKLLEQMRELVTLNDAEDYYRNKYESALQQNVELVGIHGELKALLRR